MSLLLCVTFLIDIVRLSSGIHPELFVYFAAILAVATLNGQLKLYLVGENKEQTSNQGKENAMDQGKEKSTDQSKEKSMDQSKEKSKDQGKEKSTNQGKDKSTDQDIEQSMDQDQEQTIKPFKDGNSDTEETLTKDKDDKTQKDANSPKRQTSSQFMMMEIGPLWSECDDMAIRNMCWSPQVSTWICFPT